MFSGLRTVAASERTFLSLLRVKRVFTFADERLTRLCPRMDSLEIGSATE